MRSVVVTVHTAPDHLGRVMYSMSGYDPSKPYCSVCGKGFEHSCPHTGTLESIAWGQVFFGVAPEGLV